MLYEMLSGSLPIEGNSPAAIIHRKLTAEPTPLPGDAGPQELRELCMALLERDPRKRPGADRILHVLENLSLEQSDFEQLVSEEHSLAVNTNSLSPRDAHLFGRDAELAQLREAFEQLNRRWLEASSLLEPADLDCLLNPETYVLSTGGQVFFAMENGHVVGTCAAIRFPPSNVELAKLAVSPEAHGRGIGRAPVAAGAPLRRIRRRALHRGDRRAARRARGAVARAGQGLRDRRALRHADRRGRRLVAGPARPAAARGPACPACLSSAQIQASAARRAPASVLTDPRRGRA